MKKRFVCLFLAALLMLPLIPSALALTDLNIYAESSFDKEYEVYSGPGVYYFRANDGRATYGWGGVRVYGVCGDWVMIGYGLSNGAYRIGYVSSDCLKHTKYVTGSINYNLTFSPVTMYATNNCYVTDDPVLYNDFICRIPEGQSVQALGSMGDWTYIEALTDYGYMRGFVYNFALRSTSSGGYQPSQQQQPNNWGNSYDPGVTRSYFSEYTRYAQASARLNQQLATRTGPGTQYDEPGTFLGAGSWVTAHSRVYDQMNEIWWVQVEFNEYGRRYWAYTGAKQLSNISLYDIPIEKQIGSCRTTSSLTCYYGPSYEYQSIRWDVPAGTSCKIFGYVRGVGPDDSDFIQIEFYDSYVRCTRRAWVPDWAVTDYTLYDSY